MPNIKSAKKRVLVNATKAAQNKAQKSALKTQLYTTEESEKTEVFALAEELGGDLELAIKRLAETKYK